MIFEVGLEADFYGVDGNHLKLDGTVFEVREDDNDGYRSAMEDILEVKDPNGLIFFQTPVARVRIQEISSYDGHDFDGYELVDVVDGHRWLIVGTDEYDDYYPMFTFYYTPKLKEVTVG